MVICTKAGCKGTRILKHQIAQPGLDVGSQTICGCWHLVVEEAEAGVHQSNTMLVASLDDGFIVGGSTWGHNILYPTLQRKNCTKVTQSVPIYTSSPPVQPTHMSVISLSLPVTHSRQMTLIRILQMNGPDRVTF